jgi:hypothetical protein
MCVLLITFRPSKNFENSLRALIQQHTTPTHVEARIDVIAKHCVGKLEFVSKKGPRGKPPTLAGIEFALICMHMSGHATEADHTSSLGVCFQPVHPQRVA